MSKNIQGINEEKIWYQRGKTHHAHVYRIGDDGDKGAFQHRIHDSTTGHEVHRDVHDSLPQAKKAVFSHFERLDKEGIHEMRRIPGATTHPDVKARRQQEAEKRTAEFAQAAKERQLHEEQEIHNLIGLVANQDLVKATEITATLLNTRVVGALDEYKRNVAGKLFSTTSELSEDVDRLDENSTPKKLFSNEHEARQSRRGNQTVKKITNPNGTVKWSLESK